MTITTDVAIIGGGLVGCALALALADMGLEITLIEAQTAAPEGDKPYDTRAIALGYVSTRILQGLGVWSDLSARAMPIEQVHISEAGGFGVARLSAKDDVFPVLGEVLPLPYLQSTLQQAAQKTGLVYRCPARFQALAVTPEHASVTISTDAGEETVRARLLVAADGVRSPVRTACGIEVDTRDYEQMAIVAHLSTRRAVAATAYERFTETGPVALLPLGKQAMAAVWTVRPDEVDKVMALSEAEFCRQLHALMGGRISQFTALNARQVFPVCGVTARESVRQRVVLLGNAAHTLHPVAAQGFNLSLRDTAVLAEVLVAAKRAGDDIGSLPVLQRYANWRKPDQDMRLRFTDGVLGLFASKRPGLPGLRRLGLSVFSVCPTLQRNLSHVMMGFYHRLPQLASGHSLAERSV